MIPFPLKQHSQELQHQIQNQNSSSLQHSQELQHQFQNQNSSSIQHSPELQHQFQNQNYSSIQHSPELQHQFQNQNYSSKQQSPELQSQFHEMFQQFMLFQQRMSQQQPTKYSNSAVIENNLSQFDSSPSSLHSRTTSENSNVYYTPPTFKGSVNLGNCNSPQVTAPHIQSDQLKFITKTSRKRKQSNADGSCEVSHHFQIPAMTLTQAQFSTRLSSILTNDVMEADLSRIFPSLSDFRNQFIIPLSRQITEGKTDIFPNEDTSPKNHPIALNVDMKDVLTAKELDIFSEDYLKIFLNGCHVKRKVRVGGLQSIPDTPERIMYRNFLSVLWLKLGKTY
jgi:hypothetical protein